MKRDLKKPLRELMPQVAEFIDACRESFGAADIHRSIRSGLAGEPTFYAEEVGQALGTRFPPSHQFHDGRAIDKAWHLEETKA